MAEFRMPSLGADMEEGKVVEWYVKPGSVVSKGDIVAVVETEKAAIEIEVFNDGVVEELLVEEGETVTVGSPIATIGVKAPAGEAPAPVEMPAPEPSEPAAAQQDVTEPVVVSPLVRHLAEDHGIDLHEVEPTGPGETIRREDVEAAIARAAAPTVEPPARNAAPRARRLARELGVDLETVEGSGPGGSITGDDVQRAATGTSRNAEPVAEKPPKDTAQAAGEPAEHDEKELLAQRQAAMRTAIARLMARSKREIPHYYLGQHVDVEAALTWLEDENSRRPVRERLLPAVLLLKATALAAREVPDLNGFWVDDQFAPSESVNLGVAISLRQGGLIAPAILDAHEKSLDELMAALRDLVTRTRAGRLRASEMSEATLTVTNLGDQGVETVYGVIYPPQVALVGFGRVAPRPCAVDGLLGIRRVLSLTLSADHRASDGHRGGLLLAAIERHLHEPETL